MWKSLLPTLVGKTLVEHDPSGQFPDIRSTITGFRFDGPSVRHIDYVELLTTRGGFGGSTLHLGVGADENGQLTLSLPRFNMRATVVDPLDDNVTLKRFAEEVFFGAPLTVHERAMLQLVENNVNARKAKARREGR